MATTTWSDITDASTPWSGESAGRTKGWFDPDGWFVSGWFSGMWAVVGDGSATWDPIAAAAQSDTLVPIPGMPIGLLLSLVDTGYFNYIGWSPITTGTGIWTEV